jgi:hypothetical protein
MLEGSFDWSVRITGITDISPWHGPAIAVLAVTRAFPLKTLLDVRCVSAVVTAALNSGRKWRLPLRLRWTLPLKPVRCKCRDEAIWAEDQHAAAI